MALTRNRQDSFMSPADLWSIRMDTKQVSRLTDVNADMQRAVVMSTPSSFYFEGAGDSVQAWLFKPVNFEAGKKYPLAVLIHGGCVALLTRSAQTSCPRCSPIGVVISPQGAWEDAWSYRWNPQNLAGHGTRSSQVDCD
jgi:dipeptidyl aminopeptidase/acylaminoacyl peptidase